MLLYSFTVFDTFALPLSELLTHIKHIVEEEADYAAAMGDEWPDKYHTIITLPAERCEDGVRYYVHVWEGEGC